MRITVVGENDCARALRGLLLRAKIPAGATAWPWCYVVALEMHAGAEYIEFDSVDCELEQRILRHVTSLSHQPVLLNRPGGEVHSDREIRIVVPARPAGGPDDERLQAAVERGVLRGILDMVIAEDRAEKISWMRRLYRK